MPKSELGAIMVLIKVLYQKGESIGAQLTRSAGVISQMQYIEDLLNKYQLASGIEKAKLKTQIYTAYKLFNTNFGTFLINILSAKYEPKSNLEYYPS